MKIKLIVPAYKCADNIGKLIQSVVDQDYEDWEIHIFCDNCEGSKRAAVISKNLYSKDIQEKISICIYPKRVYALQNICIAMLFLQLSSEDDFICGIIDGDDRLCNTKALSLISDSYSRGNHIVWTQYDRDDNGECVSSSLPSDADPYKYPWVSSHFRTFGSWVYDKISQYNFVDEDGNYFKRAYDQALMLPMLHYCNKNGFATEFIPEVCYRYNHKGSSTPNSEHSNGSYEYNLAKFIRGRGYVE